MESAPATARGYEFEEFVLEILRQDPGIDLATAEPLDADQGFDVVAMRGNRPLLITVQLATPQTSFRLEQVTAKMQAAADLFRQQHPDAEPQLVLAFPGVLAESKKTLTARSRLIVWDGPYLRDTAQSRGLSVPPYVAPGNPEAVGEPDSATRYASALLHRLRNIAPGRSGWVAYEKYCEDLLNFLFVPPLNPAIPQSRDGQDVNRRDYILPNYAMDGGFWQFMRGHYEAHYIVAEIKNLDGRIGKDEILQVANYLNPHGTGLFALILARQNLNDTARWICREQWVQHSKLIVGIDDENVAQMVETKLVGGDPAELIRQKIEEFRLAI